MGWDNRFAWSGEIPTSFPGLNPVALQRITPTTGVNYSDSVVPSRSWQRVVGGSQDGYAADRFGLIMGLNLVNPATDQGAFKLPHFTGLWPSSGRLLIGLWVRQNYVMPHSPLMSSRGGSSPVAYIATAASGRIRHQVYNAAGASILDQYEDHPWVQTSGLQFLGQLVDMAGQTSQMFSVDAASRASWLGPVRTLAGAPNPSSTADLDVFALPSASLWTTGAFDEAIVAHPTAAFSLSAFADSMALGLWADGQSTANASSFSLTENGITATAARTLFTGAERVSWTAQPVVTGAPAGAVPRWSTNNGSTWQTGAQLPVSLTGLLRWEVPFTSGQSFTGITVIEPTTPAPTLAAIGNISLEQGGLSNRALSFTVSGDPSWSVSAPAMVAASVNGTTLSVTAGFEVGAAQVTVTLTDDIGRSGLLRSFRTAD